MIMRHLQPFRKSAVGDALEPCKFGKGRRLSACLEHEGNFKGCFSVFVRHDFRRELEDLLSGKDSKPALGAQLVFHDFPKPIHNNRSRLIGSNMV